MSAYTITIPSSRERFTCKPGQNILQGMERSGVANRMRNRIPVGCRGGGCGVCRVRIVNGETENQKMSKKYVTEAQLEQGYVLACRANPCSDIDFELATPEITQQSRADR